MQTTQGNQPLPDLDQRAAHRRRRSAAAAATSPALHAASAVLTQRIAPLRRGPRNYRKVEQRFYTSLRHLCDLYRLPLPAPSDDPFPQNIVRTFSSLQKTWNGRGMEPVLFVAEAPRLTGTIATAMPHCRDYDLFYVPVQPVLRMMRYKKYAALTDAILCTFAYLYQRAGVSHYGQSVVGRSLDWMQESIDNGEADDYHYAKTLQKALDEAQDGARPLLNAIEHPAQLARWPGALDRLRPATDWELEIKLCCTEIYSLYRRYPKRSIPASCYPKLVYKNDEDDVLCPEDFLSFIYLDKKGMLEDNLFSYIDSFLEGKIQSLSPAALQFFDKPQPAEHFDFAFETLFFKIMNNLIDCLYKAK